MNARFEGKLKSWNDQRGFGFIVPDQGGQEVFVHISAFPRDGQLPAVDESLSFEIALNREGKKKAVWVRRSAPKVAASAAAPQNHLQARKIYTAPASRSGLRWIVVLMIFCLGAYGYTKYSSRIDAYLHPTPPVQAGQTQPMPLSDVSSAAQFSCDGRKHCSQMTSCKEATFFLKNCPDVQMDGNNDGVPCEQQWCTGFLAK